MSFRKLAKPAGYRHPIPAGMDVDHICHNRKCANVDHLRLATRSQNNQNASGARRDNKSSGVRNVIGRSNGRFYVRITVDHKVMSFGGYPTLEEAARVAETKRRELFGEFAGGAR